MRDKTLTALHSSVSCVVLLVVLWILDIVLARPLLLLIVKLVSQCGCRYLAFGTSMDYMYERLHVPYPLTIEVNFHRVLSCTHAHVGSASVCTNDRPMQVVLSSFVHEQ